MLNFFPHSSFLPAIFCFLEQECVVEATDCVWEARYRMKRGVSCDVITLPLSFEAASPLVEGEEAQAAAAESSLCVKLVVLGSHSSGGYPATGREEVGRLWEAAGLG